MNIYFNRYNKYNIKRGAYPYYARSIDHKHYFTLIGANKLKNSLKILFPSIIFSPAIHTYITFYFTNKSDEAYFLLYAGPWDDKHAKDKDCSAGLISRSIDIFI